MVDHRRRGTVIGGRHGSPTVTLALPFSNIVNLDSELRDAVADLASLVAQLAAHTEAGEATEIAPRGTGRRGARDAPRHSQRLSPRACWYRSVCPQLVRVGSVVLLDPGSRSNAAAGTCCGQIIRLSSSNAPAVRR